MRKLLSGKFHHRLNSLDFVYVLIIVVINKVYFGYSFIECKSMHFVKIYIYICHSKETGLIIEVPSLLKDNVSTKLYIIINVILFQ
jgi:hypothetical protein